MERTKPVSLTKLERKVLKDILELNQGHLVEYVDGGLSRDMISSYFDTLNKLLSRLGRRTSLIEKLNLSED